MGNDILALLAISGAILLGAMSPGASFLLVARTAVVSSRRAAISVSFGLGVGAMLFAIIALAGLHALLTLVPWLYTALKIAGGCYLLWLAMKMFRRPAGSAPDLSSAPQASSSRAFITGVITQMSNPHTALVFASIFTATLSASFSPWLYVALPVMAFLIDVIWYVMVATALSTERPRRVYLHYRRVIDRLSGGLMAVLGIRLLIK
ncbi:threonine transporter [Izhakiella australiensis]|uniref:Threonine transporter n=1 Tax=Izhakiella australiensis TaxID=1926881 RepID=A0A1S8YI08_9GAMM|nr:LysE family transporter [Izhakiella australiensis]OON38700.1 threonine transporter [Izhakiella australiensis]